MGLMRRRWPWITVLVVALAAAGALVALPEILRRVAVRQIAALTGRTAITGVRLARRGSNEPALEIRRIALRVAILPLLRSLALSPVVAAEDIQTLRGQGSPPACRSSSASGACRPIPPPSPRSSAQA